MYSECKVALRIALEVGWEVTKKETFAVNCCNQPQGQRGSQARMGRGRATWYWHWPWTERGSKAALNVNWAICCRWGLSSL